MKTRKGTCSSFHVMRVNRHTSRPPASPIKSSMELDGRFRSHQKGNLIR